MQHFTLRDKNGYIIGSIQEGRCSNPVCLQAVKQGRIYHALPTGFAMTLPTYHYVTLGEATTAIEKAWAEAAGVPVPAYLELPGREDELARFRAGERAELFQ